MAEDADQFLTRFAAPLVAGLAPACGDMMGLRAAARFGTLPSTTEAAQALWRGVRARAASVDPGPPGPLGKTETTLLVAAHDLLAGVHPESSNFLGGLGRLMRGHAELVVKGGLPQTYQEALTRHAIVEATCRAIRIDTVVSWWTGSAEFHGTEPPARLLAWPDVRRVRQDPRRVPLVKTGLSSGSVRLRASRRQLLEAMFTSSPLTPLLLAADDELPVPMDLRQVSGDPPEPQYASLRFLDHDPLRSVIADRAIAAGFHAPVATFTAAVNALLTSAAPPPWGVVRALRLVATLHERRLFAELLSRETAKTDASPEPLVPRDALAHPTQRMVYALWRAIRMRAEDLRLPGVDPGLEPLAREIESAVTGPSVVEMTQSYVRAIDARVAD